MQNITSSDNLKIKHIKKLLADKKYRETGGEFVVEGYRWISDALLKFPQYITGVFIAESESKLAQYRALLAPLDSEKVYMVSDFIMEKISDTKQPQGIAAVLKIPPKVEKKKGSRVLYLDSIRDPGNLGTIVRTAAASGYNDIMLDACADAYNPKVVRSTMGALLSVNILADSTPEDILNLKQDGFKVFAAKLSGENVFTLKQKHDKIVLLVGSESVGIRQELLDLADFFVTIPMQNNIESLNAAVSAAILMYNV